MENANNSVGIVVLARLSSSRLPGKAVMHIAGKPVLAYILERLQTVVSKQQIILATSDEPGDDALADFAQNFGVQCYRGSLTNVAQRFYGAAKQLSCTYACRINGDNIFVDADVLKTMLSLAQTGKYQFLSNVKGRTFPKGMSIEIVEMSYYANWLPHICANAYYAEHVMVYLYERGELDAHYYLMNTTNPEAAGLQLALDTPEDFARSGWIIEHLDGPHQKAGMKQILELQHAYERANR